MTDDGRQRRLFDARARDGVLDEIEGATFDLVVIGGGINGAGVAHDAALRGLSVLLVEQEDLAFGTSSRSSKLIHGGLRYLEQKELRLVYESTNERAALRRIAPHLVRPMMFALPVYEDDKVPLWMMDVGLWMYDSLSLFKVERRHVTLRSPKRMLEREPLLAPDKLTGGIIYYDCTTDDARLTLENALAASRLGARILTRARVEHVDARPTEGDAARVRLEDRLEGRAVEVRGRAVVSCSGVWTDWTRRAAGVDGHVIRATKGVHLVIPHERLPVAHANALLTPQDQRVFFAVPWEGRTYIGTTDTDYAGDFGRPSVDTDDVRYLLEAANTRYPGRDLEPGDVISSWAGLRPLVRPDATMHESDVPREHRIYTDGRLVAVAGGKLTTYRRMAAEVVNAALAAGGVKAGPSRSDRARLPGAEGLEPRAVDLDLEGRADRLARDAGLPEPVARRLVRVYGSRAEGVAAYAAGDARCKERVTPDRDVIYAEVVHAVDHELALTVEDVLFRRTSLALTAQDQALGAAERVADVMGARLGWSPRTRAERVESFRGAVALTRAFRVESPS